jgi:hypothetical protein
LNLAIWNKALQREPDWTLEFLSLNRNHGWVFTSRGHPTIACFDSFKPQDEARDVVVPHILNHHNGKLDLLLTTTPESPEIAFLESTFGPRILVVAEDTASLDTSGMFPPDPPGQSLGNIVLSDGIKVLWDRTDNISAGLSPYPAVEIDVDSGVILLAGWAGPSAVWRVHRIPGTGKGMMDSYGQDTHILLLEMPWSHYARSRCLDMIWDHNPECIVFSPDRFSSSMPRKKEQLTHSEDRTLATSLYGALAFSAYGSSLKVESMRPIR